jgi:hypothetical protein
MNIVNSLMKDLLISGGWSESCVQMYQHDYVKPNIIETYIQENKRVTGVKCSQLPWFKDEGWVENHVSISSPDHGAIAQVVIKMEDPCYLPNEEQEKLQELRGNLSLMLNSPEMYQALQTVLETFGRTDGVCVTTQTKQRVIENIRELLERVEHGR